MKNSKKNKKITAIIIVLLLIILAIIITTIAIKSKSTKKSTIEELKEYGNKVEEMDILPNTIIAKMNGEEILFHELENRRKSINYSVENGYEELKDKNAFYELLVSKLEEKMAKEYKDESNYNMNIEEERERIRKAWYEGEEGKDLEEYRKDLLDALCIQQNEIWLNEEDFVTYLENIFVNMRVQAKGMDIINKFMLERPELANDEEFTKKVETYNNTMNQIESGTNITENSLTYVKNATNQLLEIRDLYIKDLILQQDIELCAEKQELSTKTPEVYQE